MELSAGGTHRQWASSHAEGSGNCVFGNMTLNNVLYVPDFHDLRLVSVAKLNDDGIDVNYFASRAATASKYGQAIFTTKLHAGLYQFAAENALTTHEPVGQPDEKDEIVENHEPLTSADILTIVTSVA